MIRSIRKSLNALIGSQTLNNEGLITFMTEVEVILNFGPAVLVMYNDKGQESLTPITCFFSREYQTYLLFF